MQTRTHQQPPLLLALTGYAAGALLLVLLWLRNYNLVGNLYDYSIITSAAGHLQAGLLPYRDFTTPLQSLTIYMAYAAERLFGPRYLSLAYANLVLGLGFYSATLWSLRNSVPFLLRLLIAIALCSATVFQHGILWYNSIAIVLLTLIVWRASLWYSEGRQSGRQLAALCLLLFLSSMAKLNFHLLGLAITLGLASLIFLKSPPTERKSFAWIIPLILVSGLIVGPVVEILLNRTTIHDFLVNVVAMPRGRLGRLAGFLNPNLYLGKAADTYPDNWSGGIYLKALLVYAGCLWFFFRRPAGPDAHSGQSRETFCAKLFMCIVLLGFYTGALMLGTSNIETQMLTSAFLLVGLVAVFVMFAPVMSDTQSAGFKFGVFLLAGFFAIAGSASAFMHSRIRYGEPSWTDTMLKTMAREKSVSALRNAVPFYAATEIDPRLNVYFHGVCFTEPEYHKLKRLFSFLDENHLYEQAAHIYWGPELEFMNRVYNNTPAGHFPLWYDFNLSVKNSDSGQIIAALTQGDFQWIIIGGFSHTSIPAGVRAFIKDNYEPCRFSDDEYPIFYRRKLRPGELTAVPADKKPIPK